MNHLSERETLHHLIEICRDGERGFLAAADQVGDRQLKGMFLGLAAQRARFARELLPHLQRMGGPPEERGTAAGTIHRGWMAVRGALPGSNDRGFIAETQRGEHAALRAYENALEGLLPPTVSDLVEAQRDAMRQATDRIQSVSIDA